MCYPNLIFHLHQSLAYPIIAHLFRFKSNFSHYWIQFSCGQLDLLIFRFSFPEHLNVTILLGLSIIASPVAGFLPFLCAFSFTQNLPNPLARTSSPDERVRLMISRNVSVTSADLFFVNPLWSMID